MKLYLIFLLVVMKLLDTVVLNDVARRLRLRDLALLQRLITYLFSTAGNLFSTNKVVGALARARRAPSPTHSPSA